MATEATVLVTRPEGQAGPLCEALAAAGYRAVHQPLLALEALPETPAAVRRRAMDLDHYQHIIFISANAVRFGLELIDDYWPQLPAALNWYAIGGSTAALLAARGLAPVSPRREMNSEGLLAEPGLADVAGDRVLIVKGEGGRETLRDVLVGRGATVDELPCYRRVPPALATGELGRRLAQWQPQVIMLSSGEGLANLLALLSAEETSKFRNIGLVVPSPRVAELARDAGFAQVVTAANASDEAMLAALRQWRPGD